MKRTSFFVFAIVSILTGLALESCRGAVYTAPLVPRFTPKADAISVTVYTNASVLISKATGKLSLTDLLGDTGYQIYVSSVDFYAQSTNANAILASLSFNISSAATGNANIKTIQKTQNKANNAFDLNFSGVASGVNTLAPFTNTSAYKTIAGKYNVTLVTEDGNTTFVADDNAKLETSFTVTASSSTP